MAIGEYLVRKQTREKFVWLHKLRPLAKREALTGLAFISPWIIGFLVFTLLPTIATLIFTFTDLQLSNINSIQFIGLQNYSTMMRDTQVGESLFIVLKFGLIALPIGIILPLLLALLMNSNHLKGQVVFRTLFYMPYILPFRRSHLRLGWGDEPGDRLGERSLEIFRSQEPAALGGITHLGVSDLCYSGDLGNRERDVDLPCQPAKCSNGII